MGPCIHSTSWRTEKDFHGEETSLGACGEKLCIERRTFIGWEILPDAIEEEEKRPKTEGVVEKEEGLP